MISCPDNEKLQQLLNEAVGEEEYRELESHLETCKPCKQTLDRLTAFAGEALPLPPICRPATTSTECVTVPLAASATPELPSVAGYDVECELGHGGMGVVYKARQRSLNRVVALKMIRSVERVGAEARARFRAEADAEARLQHPHIVQIYDVGEAAGRPFFCLEFVDGGSLAQRLGGKPQPVQEAAQLVETLARAVHYAHQRGIVHRDLKPANILLSGGRQPPESNVSFDSGDSRPPLGGYIPKITDFGLAKHLDGEASQTQSGVIIGTPSYMAPEQAAGRANQIGPAADIYALGAILYELLTGRPPFLGETSLATLQQVQFQEPIPPRQSRPSVPRDLETICLACLQKEPDRRYADAQALAEDLSRFRCGKPIQVRPVSRTERLWRWSCRNPALAGALGAAAAALLAVAALSIGLAVYQTNAVRTLDWERRQTQAALNESRRMAAQMAVDRGLTLCEQGEVAAGMLWLVRSLELAPTDAADLQHVIRANLGGWSEHLHSLQDCLGHEDQVWSVAFSPDGRTILTGSTDKTARLWQMTRGQGAQALTPDPSPLSRRLPHPDGVWTASFSRDGHAILTGCFDRRVRLWQPATCKILCEFKAHSGPVRAAALSPDGRTIATAGDRENTARLWEASTGQALASLSHPAEVVSLAFSPDGRLLLTGGSDGRGRLWDLSREKLVCELSHGTDAIKVVAFSPEGALLLTGATDRTARLWHTSTGKAAGSPMLHQSRVYAGAFSPDGKWVLTGSSDGTARLWDAATCQPFGAPLRHKDQVRGVAFSPDSRLVLTGSDDKRARLWKIARGNEGREFQHHDGLIHAVAFSPDGKLFLSASEDKTAQLWDTATGQRVGAPLQHQARVYAVAFSPDGTLLATASEDKTAQIWATDTGKPLGSPLPHQLRVYAVAFSPDGKAVLTGSEDLSAQLWDVATSQHICPPLRHQARVRAVAFSPDGKTVVTGSTDDKAQLWDVATGKPLGPPLQHQGWVQALAFSPDSQLVLTGSNDGSARLWNAQTGRPLGTPLHHQDQVHGVAFSRDGKTILTGSWDKSARLWDVRTGQPLGPPLRHPDRIQGVAFSPDGKLALTGCWDKAARLWAVPSAVEGGTHRLNHWIHVVSGLELDEHNTLRALELPTWRECCRRLEACGGAPMP